MIWPALGLLAVLAAGAGCGKQTASGSAAAGPTGFQVLDTDSYNRRIDEALETGAEWPRSPLRTVLAMFGDDTDTRDVRIEESKNLTEGADRTAFVVEKDGILDDSIRGSWLEAELERQDDGTWRVTTARIAWRCWRAKDPEAWTAEPCP